MASRNITLQNYKKIFAVMADKEGIVKFLNSQTPEGHIILSGRYPMEKEEDTRSIGNMTSYNSFIH